MIYNRYFPPKILNDFLKNHNDRLDYNILGHSVNDLPIYELNIGSGSISTPYLFLSGILAFSFFLIPGISGSAMLVVLGVYGPVIQAVANFNLNLLAPFGIGCLISLLLLPKVVLSIYSSHEQKLMYIFSGLIFSSGIFLL